MSITDPIAGSHPSVLATLGAIALAFDIKRIPWRTPLRILIASYWVSFGVGVVQWLSIRLHAKPLTDYFSHLMYRQYISDNSVWGGGRPQFLFAEPSYIGMHLFGILLQNAAAHVARVPAAMIHARARQRIGTNDSPKRLRDLIVTYAVGAVLMQAGTRIVIDSVVALLIALVARTDWHDGEPSPHIRGDSCRFSAHAHANPSGCWRIPDSPPRFGEIYQGAGSFFKRVDVEKTMDAAKKLPVDWNNYQITRNDQYSSSMLHAARGQRMATRRAGSDRDRLGVLVLSLMLLLWMNDRRQEMGILVIAECRLIGQALLSPIPRWC